MLRGIAALRFFPKTASWQPYHRQAAIGRWSQKPTLHSFKLFTASGFVVVGTLGTLQVHPAICDATLGEIEVPPRELFDHMRAGLPSLERESATWTQDIEKTCPSYAISIRSAASHIKGVKGRRYRIEIRIAPENAKSLTPERIMEGLKDFSWRLKWDPNLVEAKVLHYAGPCEPDVVMYRTRPAAGGMISSREFVDARLQIREADDIIHMVTRWDQKLGLSCNVQRAFNVPGVKSHICREADGAIRMTSFGHSDIGGWIPTQVLNATVADAHLRFAVSFLAAIGVS